MSVFIDYECSLCKDMGSTVRHTKKVVRCCTACNGRSNSCGMGMFMWLAIFFRWPLEGPDHD